MFVVWLGAVVTALLTMAPGLFGPSGASAAYNGVVTVILVLTVWFANFAEALAEGRGKAKAASLRRTKTELMAERLLPSGEDEAGRGDDLAQGGSGPRRERRGHSDRRRGRRRGRVCRRIRHHRRVGTRAQRARNRHVLLGHRRHVGHLGPIARPGHRRSWPKSSTA